MYVFILDFDIFAFFVFILSFLSALMDDGAGSLWERVFESRNAIIQMMNLKD